MSDTIVWATPPDCPKCGKPLVEASPEWRPHGEWMCLQQDKMHDGKRLWWNYELTMILRSRLSSLTSRSSEWMTKLLFGLGEEIWLAGQQSYLISAPGAVDYSKPDWRETWYTTTQPIKITGLKLSFGKIYYEFPGGGNDDGSRMYRTRLEAETRAAAENAKIKPK